MNKFLVSMLVLVPAVLWAQDETTNDSVIDRTVTVEREFQPTVKAAGKLPYKPAVFTPQLQEKKVTYSDYSAPLSTEKNMSVLGYATTTFNRPSARRGFIRGGIGHPNTLFDFNYRVDSESMGTRTRRGKTVNEGFLDLHANHYGQWGRKMLEQSEIGLDYTKAFSAAQLYLGLAGGNEYFTHYYRYYDPTTGGLEPWKNFQSADNQAFWTADFHIGVQNVPGADIRYKVQTGYEGFILPGNIFEHQVNSQAMFEWSRDAHSVGLEASVKNRLYTALGTGVALTGKHQVHAEPYYGYEGSRIRVHAGVNLDLGLGGYNRMFGASPNVHFEADITKTWLSFFLGAKGELAAEGIREELQENRFLDVTNLLDVMQNGCCATYVPVDAVAGFRFKPLPTLLFDVHAGYSFTMDKHILGYDVTSERFLHFEQDQQIVKVGGSLHYHYQDIFTMEVGGDYFFAPSKLLEAYTAAEAASLGVNRLLDLKQSTSWTGSPYSAPDWMVHARFDGRIDKHWALYSDNYLVGTRKALIVQGTYVSGVMTDLKKNDDESLQPYFHLNLGVQYSYDDRLSFFGQLNNFLAWTPSLTGMLLYNTPAQGVNCLLGASWTF